MFSYHQEFFPTTKIYNPLLTNTQNNIFETQRITVPQDHQLPFHQFWNKKNIEYISNQITLRLINVHPEKKNILVPYDTIISVMDSFWHNSKHDPDVSTMMTISYIVNNIKNEFEVIAQNNKLSIWVTNFGEDTGLRQTPKIKLRERGPNRFEFINNY
jgi:hypothetical protein